MPSLKYTEETLKDQKFSSLTFISFADRTRDGKRICKWKCDCGNETTGILYDVIYGLKGSCGCYCNKRGKDNPYWKGYEEITGGHWRRIIDNAKGRGHPFHITIEDVWNQFVKQSRVCPYTGETLAFSSSWKNHDGTASLDRIDSTRGYETDNIQWVHKDINRMKSTFTSARFVTLCKKVASFHR